MKFKWKKADGWFGFRLPFDIAIAIASNCQPLSLNLLVKY